MPVIAMTREMGSRGKDVALRLAEMLDLEIVHHELVEHNLAEKMDLRESAVHRYLEGRTNLLDRWRIDKKRLAYCTADEMFELAERGNALIRGWGATKLLSNIPHVVCVRVCAPMQSRVSTLMERLDIDSEAVALKEIQENDAAHARVMHETFQVNWEDPVHYDLVLNTDRVGIDECAELVKTLAESTAFAETQSSRTHLAEMKRLAGIRSGSQRDLLSQGVETQVAMGPEAGIRMHVKRDERPATRENRDVLF
jgi:cytidylate kinase